MSKLKIKSIFRFLLFSVSNFAPYIAVLLYLNTPSLLADVIKKGWYAPGPVEILISYFLLFVSLFSLSFISYRFFMRCTTFLKRAFVLYVSWLILIFPLLLFEMHLIGGVSMAVVDGGVSGIGLLLQSLRASLVLLLLAHIFLVPWILICIFCMKPLFKKQQFK